jgi:hypothetical protein
VSRTTSRRSRFTPSGHFSNIKFIFKKINKWREIQSANRIDTKMANLNMCLPLPRWRRPVCPWRDLDNIGGCGHHWSDPIEIKPITIMNSFFLSFCLSLSLSLSKIDWNTIGP